MSSPKLQLQHPSDKIIKNAKAKLEDEIIDADGKVYKLRLPDPIDEFDLYAALGKEHSTNLGLLIQATPLLYIQSIDGVEFLFSGTYNGLRTALKQVGRNGMKAVTNAMQKFLLAEQGDAEEQAASLKK